MIPELTPVTLIAFGLAIGCFALAGLVAMAPASAVALVGAGTTLIAAVGVKRSGDVKAPKDGQ